MCKEYSEHKAWHSERRIKNGKLRHPADAEGWKSMDDRYPNFTIEPRNVRSDKNRFNGKVETDLCPPPLIGKDCEELLRGCTKIPTAMDLERFSYSVHMEYVKEDVGYTEIGGVYVKKVGDGWKLLDNDKDVCELVNSLPQGLVLDLYIDTVVNKAIEPAKQLQPHVIIKPRTSFFEADDIQVKRKYVTLQNLQQEQEQKKKKKTKKDDTHLLAEHSCTHDPKQLKKSEAVASRGLKRNMKPIRTRVVKKRVKPRDPLISKVLIPIQEESFELPEQVEC
ncbi:hypothetical protein AgCh_001720 [Apium graveolens]